MMKHRVPSSVAERPGGDVRRCAFLVEKTFGYKLLWRVFRIRFERSLPLAGQEAEVR